MATKTTHQHDDWQIREAPDGSKYCAACGEKVWSPTPTLDRMLELHPRSQAIGEFLEAQAAKGYRLLKWVEQDEEMVCTGSLFHECHGGRRQASTGEDMGKCSMCGGTGKVTQHFEGWVPHGQGIEQLLAEYFEIDLQEAEKERRWLLERMRSMQE